MSPEQMRSSRDIDGRTDIWSLGVILYELLADGCSPFEAATLPAICARVLDSPPPPLRKIRRDVPRALEAVVLRCLQKDPDRRFQTVAGLAQALATFGPPDATARARRVRRILEGAGLGTRTARFRPSRWPVGGAIAAAALLILGGIFLLHPGYVQSTVLAGRAWTHWTVHLAQATAAAAREAPPPSSGPLEAPPPPREAPAPIATEPPPVPAPMAASESQSPVSEPPAPSVLGSPAPPRASEVTTPRVPSSGDPSSLESLDVLVAEARGEAPPVDATAKSGRARASHRRPGKRFVTEQTPSPDPAPPIVVPSATGAAHPADGTNPYEETVAVPDLGGRE